MMTTMALRRTDSTRLIRSKRDRRSGKMIVNNSGKDTSPITSQQGQSEEKNTPKELCCRAIFAERLVCRLSVFVWLHSRSALRI